MKKLLLIAIFSFFTISVMSGQKIPAAEQNMKQNEWHKLDTYDDFGDVNGSYQVLTKMIDCKSSNKDDYNIAVRIARTKENDHTVTFWSEIKENKPFDFPIALFPTVQVKRENGNIEKHEIPMMSDGKVIIFHDNALGKLLNNGTGEQLKILINFSDDKSLLEKCLIPIVTH